jgi:gluconokinase
MAAKVDQSISAKWVLSLPPLSDAYLSMNSTQAGNSPAETAGKSSQSMMQTPCSDYKETNGLIYFARMLDKIRLRAAGRLPDGYFTGVDEDPTFFDARCTRFLGVAYDELVQRTLQGGSDEEIFDWCFERGRKSNDEEIEIWNAFIAKRGWRDSSTADLQAAKERAGWGNRDDIQTWVDLHEAEEGRKPKAEL